MAGIATMMLTTITFNFIKFYVKLTRTSLGKIASNNIQALLEISNLADAQDPNTNAHTVVLMYCKAGFVCERRAAEHHRSSTLISISSA